MTLTADISNIEKIKLAIRVSHTDAQLLLLYFYLRYHKLSP